MKRRQVFPATVRRRRYSIVFTGFLAIVLLATACGGSTPPATTEPSPQPTATSAATIPDLPLAEIPLSKYLRFDRISTEQGLSGNEVWSIAQDKQGFMWFGTTNGLNRYDGYEFKVFKHDPDDLHSLSENLIRALYTDHTGTLWIGTWSGGLNRYVPETDRFIRYQHDPDDPHSLGSNSIRVIFEDQAGTLWLGTVGGGLNRFDRETEQFVRYLHDPDDPGSLSGNDIYSIYEDRSGSLWVATWAAGLNKFDRVTEQFIRYLHNPADPSTLSNNNPYAIFEDQAGVLWIGTWDAGLNRFDRETEQFTRFLHDPDDPSSLSHNQAISIYEDQAGDLWIGTNGGGLNRLDRKSERFFRYQHITTDPYSLAQNNVVPIFEDQGGILWIGTFGGGVSIYDRRKQKFAVFRHDSTDPHSLSSSDVRAIHEDRAGNLWIGTVDGGLDRFEPETGQYFHYLHNPDDPHSLSNNNVSAIYEDKAGQLWLGTGGGLNRFDPQTEQFRRYLHNPDDANSLSHNRVVRILEDQTGILWIATFGGLTSFDQETGQFTRYLHDPDDANSLSHSVVWTISEDRAGDLWIGTESGGLNRFDRETEQFIRYRHDPNDPASLSRDGVKAIHEDRSGTLWIGTFGGGLNKLDRKTGGFIHYGGKEGLPDDSINAILEDEQGNLWLATSNSISRFNPQAETFRNYDEGDGLQSNEFNVNAAFRRSDGQMFFGGVNGLNAFYPADLQDNSHVPPIVITDFQLANEPVPFGGDSVLQQAINETNELVLSYQDRVISFEFAALDYAAPDKNRYRYKLEGFEDAWNEVGHNRRFVTYTNLDPGHYVFRVTGSNNNGIWNEAGTTLAITITPPWWQTTWFRVLLAVLVVGLVAGGFVWQRRSAKRRERQLESQVAQRTQELEVATDQAETASRAKSAFLANMSHELRTPLNAILGFARLMSRDENLNAQEQERLEIINRSGEHLLDMVGDILTLSRIEASRVSLSEERFDLRQTLEDIGRIFRSRTEGKGLRFSLELAHGLPPYLLGDAGKLRQVLINLLDNAVKFTQEGEVCLRARAQAMADDSDKVMLQLEVEDSGPGIPQDHLDEVFESFVRVEHAQQTQPGTGLGLSISKSLVEMMGGDIVVESQVGQGSLFTVNIPMLLADGEAVLPDEPPVPEVVGLHAGQRDWRILVVDDNRENLLLLTDLLTQTGFSLQEAENGAEAVAKFQEWRPHFIWMDVRVPVMDGYEATKKIRALPGGKKVKIVAVTASAIDEPRKVALAAGCDDVVLKPFRDQEIFEVMARELGVEYLYRDRTEAPAQPEGIPLSVEMLADLPPELLQELSQTTLVMDREATLVVIERIEDHAPETAASLRALVENYQMGRVRDLLKETETKNGG